MADLTGGSNFLSSRDSPSVDGIATFQFTGDSNIQYNLEDNNGE